MIVEIGPQPFVSLALPKETLFYSTQWPNVELDPTQIIPSLGALIGVLGRGDVEMVVVFPGFSAPWSLRHLNRSIFSRRLLEGRSPLIRAIAPELLRWRGRAPVVVVDLEDLPVINRNNLFLLDRCALYFKRELPADHWRVFLKTAHDNLPTPRFRAKPVQARRVAKLRPISLGLPRPSRGLLPLSAREKRSDVFFSGRIADSSTLRAQGLAELRALAGQGVAIDIPEAPLPREAFYQRCAEAWLVWSPEGFGWDCFRHYEAAACGSVPLINQPTIERHAPLLAGEQALYYEPEPGGLTRAVEAALADRAALSRIAAAGQAHVMAHHTIDALARHIVDSARAMRTIY